MFTRSTARLTFASRRAAFAIGTPLRMTESEESSVIPAIEWLQITSMVAPERSSNGGASKLRLIRCSPSP